nr:RagB/SusD family nutrient uptake outer membrane protein [Haliscomenobacter sp.]
GAASITGYLVRKFVDPSMGFAPKPGEERTSWKEIRFAEVLLIYAEAANEQNGPSAPIYEAVNRIRLRAGMPVLPAGLTKEAMRERIRHERQIELAFENHRWFDLIRWGIAREILDGYVPHGIMIERKPGAPTRTQMPQLFDPVWLMFTRFEVSGANQFFPSSHFLLPIPQDELDKNPNLSQNPGY